MTLPLPTTVKDPRTQQVLDYIAEQFPIQGGSIAGVLGVVAAGSHRIAFGETEAEWGGEITSKTKTVTHGLGKTPVAVVANAVDSGRCAGINGLSSSNFTFNLQTLQGDKPSSGTKTVVYWVAIA